jgi:hypothetical protein
LSGDTDSKRRDSRLTPSVATAIYLAVTLVFTWPLALGLHRDIPWDLGDSLLNAWILAWNADHLARFLSGDVAALNGFWNANIFHPEPLALGFSEHLLAQSVQILPVYAATGNIILAYNLLFISTFVLSGLGTFLFVREVTGSPRAGLVAGFIYAFAPYRVPQFAHLQVLSSQWMPFALYGMRRYFEGIDQPTASSANRHSWRPLAGAGLALVVQNLSNGYFLFFFSPFVVLYTIYEMARRGLWRDRRVWVSLVITAALVTAVTLPFLMPYLELRRSGQPPRAFSEIVGYSADVYSYLTAPPESPLWGQVMRAFPKPEGDLFPPATALLLGIVAFGASVLVAAREATKASLGSALAIPVVYGLIAIVAIYAVLVLTLLGGYRVNSLGPLPITVRGLGRPVLVLVTALVLLAALSPRARAFARAWLPSVAALGFLAMALAFALSLGPEIRSDGRLIGQTGPYALLYQYVPGFDGLRVPARFAMPFLLFLATAAGSGAALLERRFRYGGALVLMLGALAVVEGWPAPIILNGSHAEGRYAAPPSRVYTGSDVPPVYRYLSSLPRRSVIVEFPFGETAYELRYMFYSTQHWHPLLNGYSGVFPLSYGLRVSLLSHPLNSPDFSWNALMEGGATHAVLHQSLYLDDEGRRIATWLESRGATQVAEFDGDRVFELR